MSQLLLSYRVRSQGEEWTSVEEEVLFAWTRTAFNGCRRWFLCPSCRRRCRILYGGTYFRCRKCHGLIYESQFEKDWQRRFTRACDARKRLGGSGSIDDLFPPKPKRMHWTTYRRLEAEDQYAQALWDGFQKTVLNEHRD